MISMIPEDKGVVAIHHKGINMDPLEFTQRTINAIEKALDSIH